MKGNEKGREWKEVGKVKRVERGKKLVREEEGSGTDGKGDDRVQGVEMRRVAGKVKREDTEEVKTMRRVKR